MTQKQLRRKLVPVAVAALTVFVLLLATPTAWTDDVDLLRQKGGKPFVFLLIDTSTSMNLSPDNQWLPAGGDDPRSKIFQVKRAVYEVFSAVDDVHYGFAGFNQDRLRVQSKHWLYGANSGASWFNGTLEYPSEGEAWTFGAHFDLDGDGAGEDEAGTCATPLDLSSERLRINRYAKLDVDGTSLTTLWIEEAGTTYRLKVERDPTLLSETTELAGLGLSNMTVGLTLDRIADCSSLTSSGSESQRVSFRRGTDFLLIERDVGLSGTNASTGSADADDCTGFDKIAGLWDSQDVAAADTCGTDLGGPFTGRGWEGNNDSGARTGDSDVDECCIDSRQSTGACVDLENNNVPAIFLECYNARFPTVVHSSFPELDRGDMIPFNWEVEFKDEFLKRLNPRHPGGVDYRVATYFENAPDAATQNLQLRNDTQRPLVAFGNSPLGRAINDFRCWYRGGQDSKCNGPSFDPGWEELLFANDLEFGCRIPWLIVISDGEDNGTRENPSADTANLWAKAGIRTFVISFPTSDNDGANLNSIAQNGNGELIFVDDGADLKTRLEEIVGIIKEESRAFASAAVPSVQAAVEDKIFITNFTPLNGAGWWDGHAHSFLKPLPLDEDTGRPDFGHPNHLWDAGVVMLDQAPSPAADGDNSAIGLQIGGGENERRLYYSREPDPGDSSHDVWTENRQFFQHTDGSDLALENDLWKDLLGSTCDSGDTTCQDDNRTEANDIIGDTLAEKTFVSPDLGTLTYILGDIFHSDPLVVGSPANTTYFAQNLGVEVAPEKGYREFFRKHQNRRKVLFFGANDGQLHAINSGRADVVSGEVQFDNGTGHELFAYVPRAALPTVAGLSNEPLAHRWGVDGPPVVADVFIDVVHGGTPDPDDREWRTVLLNGMREGGRAYFALDVTQPDELEERTVSGATVVLPPTTTGIVPDCHNQLGTTDLGCHSEVPYPAVLWEFTDSVRDTASQELVELDEDKNGSSDLGETWSAANIGRIRICEGDTCLPSNDPDNPDDIVTKFVAIFGGGMDPGKTNAQGDWLYIVDIETGNTLYKRQLDGSAPSGPAAVDTDGDGFFDRIYIGTTAGFMYRVDLVEADSSGNLRPFPKPQDETVNRLDDVQQTVKRIKEIPTAGADPVWQPQKIFDTGGRPIYFRPSVLFVAQLGRYAITFGTGEREDLAAKTLQQGRFYAFVDDSDLVDASNLPFTESNLTGIAADQAPDASNTNLLTQSSVGSRGWFLILNEEERLIANPFGLSGVTFFTTFESDVVNEGGEVGPGGGQNSDPLCSLTGNSRIFVVNTTNANPFITGADSTKTRYIEAASFVTNPFTEQAQTKNPSSSSDSGPTADDLGLGEVEIMEALKQLFPRECKFANYRIDIKTIAADTRIQRIAPVPICIIEKNWKEF